MFKVIHWKLTANFNNNKIMYNKYIIVLIFVYYIETQNTKPAQVG